MITEDVKTDAITEGDRRREEYGDIDALAASIARYGLLHPLVVDERNRLVAGGRRLRAVRSLGWKTVPVRYLGTLSNDERREIELEENTQRKDLTPYELDRRLIADAKAMGERMLSTKLVDKPSPKARGHAPTYGVPKAEVAAALNVSTSELVRAEQRIAAVEAHPEVRNEPQSVALDYAAAVAEHPEQKGEPPKAVAQAHREEQAQRREQEREDRERTEHALSVVDATGEIAAKRSRQVLIEQMRDGMKGTRDLIALNPEKLTAAMTDAHILLMRPLIAEVRQWCDAMEVALKPGPRLVAKEG